MTWTARWQRFRPAIAAALTVITAGAILTTAGFLALPPPADPLPHCIDLVSHALVSVDQPVAGSYDCLAFNERFGLAQAGYEEMDLGLMRWVSEQGRNRLWPIEHAEGGPWVFEISGPAVPNVMLFLWLDGHALVDRIDSELLGR